MSSELTTRRGAIVALSEPPPKLKMSEMLDWVYDRTEKTHQDAGAPVPTPLIKAEAARLLEQLKPFGERVPPEVITMWVRPLTASVRNVRSREEMIDWYEAVYLALKALEVGAFTEVTQAAALQKIKFLPSAADLYDFLCEPAIEIRTRLRVLNSIASTG